MRYCWWALCLNSNISALKICLTTVSLFDKGFIRTLRLLYEIIGNLSVHLIIGTLYAVIVILPCAKLSLVNDFCILCVCIYIYVGEGGDKGGSHTQNWEDNHHVCIYIYIYIYFSFTSFFPAYFHYAVIHCNLPGLFTIYNSFHLMIVS